MAVMNPRDLNSREIPGFHGRGGTLFVLSIVFVFIAAGLVALRVSTRFTTKRGLGKDDYFILLATVMFIPSQLVRCSSCFFLTEFFKVFDIGLTIVDCVGMLVPETPDRFDDSNKR